MYIISECANSAEFSHTKVKKLKKATTDNITGGEKDAYI